MRGKGAWRVMVGLSLLVGAYALVLVAVPAMRAPFIRERLAEIPLIVFAHFICSGVALALGPFQFDAALRSRRLTLHRWMGRAYVGSVVLGGLSGLVMATRSQGGMTAHAGFGLLAIAWLFTVLRAYQRIKAGDDVEHRVWMIRNFALTLAAVTLRLELPIMLVLGFPFAIAYPAVSWLCWVPNLIVAERWFVPRQPPSPAAAGVR